MSRHSLIVLLGGVALAAAVVVGGIAGVVLVADGAAAQQRPADSGQTIHVSASGQAAEQPDEAVIRVSVEATAQGASTARTQVAENVSAVRAALTEVGIPEDQVRTVGFNIYQDIERPRPEGEEEPEITYRAQHSLEIRVTDVDRVGAVIDAAVDHGATSVTDVEYTLAEETRSELRQQALEEAMANARSQADTLASSAGLSISGVHSASTADVSVPRHVVYAEAAGGAGGGTELDAGPVTVSATVSVTYNATS